jgi:type IV pilus assembly protein PilM
VVSIVGIDIGRRFVKVIQLQRKLSLNNWFIFPTPYTKNEDLDSKELINRITSYIPLNLLKNSHIGINIPSSLVKVVVIHLPKMSKKEIPVAVAAEARRRIVPTPTPESVFEYSILRETVIESIPRLEVLVVESRKEYIYRLLDIFSNLADLHPVLISPTCATIVNCFPHAFGFQHKNVAFVDIGYDSLDIVITKKGKLNFYRTIKFGLRDVISHISEANNLSLEEAEEIIKGMGVPQIDIDLKDRVKIAEEIMWQKYQASQKEKAEKVTPLELRMLWQANIERMIQEIRRTLIYYKEQSQGERVDEFYFLGGGAKIKGLIDVVSKEIGGMCKVFDPFEKIEINLAKEKEKIIDLKPLFVPALSLALTVPLVGKGREINFLPQELKKKEIVIRKQIGVIFLSTLIFCFVFLGWLNLLITNKGIASTVAGLKVERKRKEKILRKLEELKREKVDIESKAKSIL